MIDAAALETNDRSARVASLSGAIAFDDRNFRDLLSAPPAETPARWFASIVEFAEDAIISTDLNGVIASWNRAAQRIFGYAAGEMIGGRTGVLIPPELENEEAGILKRIRRGERVDHYETVRRRKDGSRVDISLTVSPVRSATGAIVGASKVARDISEDRRMRDQQALLLAEMDHRIKNLFSLANALVSMSARSSGSSGELAINLRERLGALARAHSLAPAAPLTTASRECHAKLRALIETMTAPYEYRMDGERERVTVNGADISVSQSSLPTLALLFHELTTNAAKYGALSAPEGRVDIHCEAAGDMVLLSWTELGGPPLSVQPRLEGFGSRLIRMAVESRFNGMISRDWLPQGLAIRLSLARERLAN